MSTAAIEDACINAALTALTKGSTRLTEKASNQHDPADRCVTNRTIAVLVTIASDIEKLNGSIHE